MFFFYMISLLALVDFTHGSGCEANCSDKPVFSPSRLVVQFNDSASARCKVCERDCIGQLMDLELSVGRRTPNGTTISWEVDRLTEWGFFLQCFYEHGDGQCCVKMPITVYQPPQRVSLVLSHTGPLSEGRPYTLKCTVYNVAPLRDVVVTFYRGQTVLNTQQFINDTNDKPMSDIYHFNFNASKEDNGEDFWCDAKMELGAEGPRHPPQVASEKITAQVFYQPQREGPSNPITIHEGETLQLNCSAIGNPPPSYSWTLPTNTRHTSNSSVLTITNVAAKHAGKYTCVVSNRMRTLSVEFQVNVIVNYTGYIVLGVLLALLAAIIAGVLIYRRYYSNNKTGRYDFMKVSCLKGKHTSGPTAY